MTVKEHWDRDDLVFHVAIVVISFKYAIPFHLDSFDGQTPGEISRTPARFLLNDGTEINQTPARNLSCRNPDRQNVANLIVLFPLLRPEDGSFIFVYLSPSSGPFFLTVKTF